MTTGLTVTLLVGVLVLIGTVITNMSNLSKDDKDGNKKKRMWVYLSVLLVAALAAAVYLIFILASPPDDPDPTPAPTQTAEATPHPTQTAEPSPISTLTPEPIPQQEDNRSSDKTDASARYMAVLSRLRAKGLPDDPAKSTEWLEKTVEQGDPDAVKVLADRLIHGEYDPEDEGKVIALFEKAADLPDDGAYFAMWLGWMYDKGEKLSQNTEFALNWYRKGANGNNAYAQYRLGAMMLDKSGSCYAPEEAVTWLTKAADQDQLTAIHLLADRYLYGDHEGISQNVDNALTLYKKGVELGSADLAKWLSRLYTEGTWVEKNEKEAAYWAERATDIEKQNATE